MIAAAVAAMIGGARAATCVKPGKCDAGGAGTAHKVAITLKTTEFKGSLKKNKKCDPCDADTYNCTYWRDQATKKINGLIWEQLGDCTDCIPFGANSAFWTKDGAIDAEFSMGVGLIGKATNSKKIEAYGGLDGDDFGHLAWAGFGTMAGYYKDGGDCGTPECLMYVKSITGGIAGQLIPDDTYYADLGCGPVVYDGCCDDMQLANTAAYGTIKITYDAATAKKVAVALDDKDINEFYKLPAAAALDFDADVGEFTPSEVTIEE